ncbi:MAG: hypothetical protein WC202_14005, partial [Desulfobacterales bacterium]
MTGVLENLTINLDAVDRNLRYLHGINLAESVMIELTKRGMKRQEAHEIIRESSMEALAAKLPLADLLAEKPAVTEYVSADEIKKLLQPETYAGLAGVQVENLIRKLAPYCAL